MCIQFAVCCNSRDNISYATCHNVDHKLVPYIHILDKLDERTVPIRNMVQVDLILLYSPDYWNSVRLDKLSHLPVNGVHAVVINTVFNTTTLQFTTLWPTLTSICPSCVQHDHVTVHYVVTATY